MNHQHSNNNLKNIGLAFSLNFSFTILEIIGGVIFNSLAIISDALHDAGDSLSLGLSWYFERYSNRQRDQKYTYGYRRYSLLGAVVNTIILFIGAVIIVQRTLGRLINPVSPDAFGMMGFAILGIIVNGLAVWRLKGSESFNTKLVFWHLLEDVLGWVAVLVVSIVLRFTNWYFLDPLLALIITLYVLFNVLKNLRKTLAVFLQSVPENISNAEVIAQLSHIPKVKSVHHTHLWSIDGEHHVLTTHVVVEEDTSKVDIVRIKEQVRQLANTLNCEHITVEIEYCDTECTMYPKNHDAC